MHNNKMGAAEGLTGSFKAALFLIEQFHEVDSVTGADHQQGGHHQDGGDRQPKSQEMLSIPQRRRRSRFACNHRTGSHFRCIITAERQQLQQSEISISNWYVFGDICQQSIHIEMLYGDLPSSCMCCDSINWKSMRIPFLLLFKWTTGVLSLALNEMGNNI